MRSSKLHTVLHPGFFRTDCVPHVLAMEISVMRVSSTFHAGTCPPAAHTLPHIMPPVWQPRFVRLVRHMSHRPRPFLPFCPAVGQFGPASLSQGNAGPSSRRHCAGCTVVTRHSSWVFSSFIASQHHSGPAGYQRSSTTTPAVNEFARVLRDDGYVCSSPVDSSPPRSEDQA